MNKKITVEGAVLRSAEAAAAAAVAAAAAAAAAAALEPSVEKI